MFHTTEQSMASYKVTARSRVSQKWHLKNKALSISVTEWEKYTLASKKLQMKDRCQPSRDCLALNQKSETRNLAFVMHSHLSSDDPEMMEDVGKNKQNLVSPTRAETDSNPLPAISIEILFFGDWKCCLFSSFLKQWFGFAALLWVVLLPAPFLFMDLLQLKDRETAALQPSTPHLDTLIVQGMQGQVRHCCETPRPLEMVWSYCPGDGLEEQLSISSCFLAWALLHPFAPHTSSFTSCRHSNAADLPVHEWNTSSRGAWDEIGKRQHYAALSVTAQSWAMEQSLKGFSEHSSFDWTNSASKLALTQPQKTASVSPCDCSAQLAKALAPWARHSPRVLPHCRQPSHHSHPGQTGDIPSYKPTESPSRLWDNSRQI